MAQTLTLAVHSMTCEGCVRALHTALNNIPSIEKATVTLDPAQAVITYDTDQTTPDALCSHIENAGFNATRRHP